MITTKLMKSEMLNNVKANVTNKQVFALMINKHLNILTITIKISNLRLV